MNLSGQSTGRSPEIGKLKAYLSNMVIREIESQNFPDADRREMILQVLQQA